MIGIRLSGVGVNGNALSPAFAQQGPTLDLVFAGQAEDTLTDGPSLDLMFVVQTYQVSEQYLVWE
jgi:hypothetical protein